MEALLPELVARQVVLTPDAVAVADAGRQLGYAELDRRANQLAHLLGRRGVTTGSLVAVCLHRGVDLAVALLGVWRSGAAYVPMDPGHPQERLNWMLADTGARFVITERALAETFDDAAATPILLDGVTEALDTMPVSAPNVRLGGDDAAYVIYTSGSTGRPKGVVIEHAGIANRVSWTVARHGLAASDRVLQKTSLGFDAAGWEFFGPLISGGTVVMAPRGAERDPAALVAAIADNAITVLQGVPSVLRLLVEEPGWQDCQSLRLIFSAGEPLDSELCLALRAPGKAEVWNTYGPTECSIDVTAHQYDPAQLAGPVPIGRPITGMWVAVLDSAGDPVPIGVPGELHVGGVGVGRGYHGRPAVTAEKFVPDSFHEDGSRLYRTGDLVRWRADETLEYMGRLDDQVKINGVRIEPGEVEVALRTHPDVRGAAVVAVADAKGAKRLVAYLVTVRPLPADALRLFLRDRVPEALIPAVYVFLDSLPLTVSGKIDRAQLPPPPEETATEYVAPRTPAERMVAEVWQELLGVERVGVHDDFFRLGGSSLVLTRLATRLRARSGGDVHLGGLFGASTVEAQAKAISAAQEEIPTITPVSRDEPLPLSFGQHRLWFLDQMHPGSPEWVAPLMTRLPADVDVSTVHSALNALEARHEALRTRYIAGPFQVIAEPGQVELRVVDASVGELETLFAEQFARGFDLVNGPLWRAMLVRIPGEESVLLVTIHHIASDGWSTVVLERELRDLCAGRPLALLPVQYADFASWQRDQLIDEALAGELDFWKNELADLEPFELPTDRPRPAERDSRGAGVRLELSPRLADAVTALGRQCGATPFMTLMGAFAALLSKYSGHTDLAVGTPVAGRGNGDVENVVGFFLNSLVVRCDLTGDPSFAAVVDRVRERSVAAFAHQDLPFEQLVNELQPVPDLSRTPLYQVAFDLQDEGATTVAADSAVTEAFQNSWNVAKTDLTLFMWRGEDGGLLGAFEYATSIFDESTIQRMADHFVRLLEAVVADPDSALSTVELLSAEEQDTLDRWGTNPCLPVSSCVHEHIQRRMAEAPTAVAVTVGENDYTYAELEARANRLAHRLRDRGVSKESVVGVLLDRGIDLLVSMLAIWKAGGAYVPMDPSFPADRLGYMAATADMRVVITASAYADLVEVDRILVDTHAAEIAAEHAEPCWSEADLDSLAYIIFTSGSTGRPKGVAVSHRGLANHVWWAANELARRGHGGAPVFSSTSFDLVVPNVWAPLVVGQRTWLLPPDVELDGLGRALADAGPFSFIKLTPGHLEMLGHQLTPSEVDGLAEVIVVAGDALPGPLAQRWRDLLGDGRLINEYGPTEASVGTCILPVTGQLDMEIVPIGRPLPNMAMYVVDDDLRRLPIGVAGELCVGGAGVARGYVNRPDLTAERFVPDPFGPSGARMYRSGDLVRMLPDGTVDFLGRVDDQVKINGYRVEPGEIRATLIEHPDVVDAVVVAGDGQLIAYYVGEASDLAAHCALRLPAYLVPAVFVSLAAIPLNANGKIDRKALPVPGSVASSGEEFAAPRTVVEERIAEIWCEILDLPQVSVHVGFFVVGGHSIRAVQLVSQLQSAFGVTVPIRAVFERPTIAQLAEEIEALIEAEISGLSEAELLAAYE